MKRILFLTGSLASGGAERQMVTISRLLKSVGYNVEFVCYGKGDFYAELLHDEGIRINWFSNGSYLKRIINIRNHVRKGNYDVVISFLEVPNFINNLSAVGGRNWKVITGERSAKERTFLSLKGKCFAWFQRFSDQIVCNSVNAKNMWIKYFPKYKDKLITIHNTITLEPINSDYTPKVNNVLHVVIAASFQHLKNPINLINALAKLNETQRGKIKLNWYGRKEFSKGDNRAYIDALNLIKQHNLEEVIVLNDEVKDISDKMYSADVVALFSRVEGLPNAICEGMMIGKPIIMSRVSDYSTLVDRTNGFLCDWDDVKSIKEALISAINLTEEKLLEMGRQSKNKAVNLFQDEVIIQKWIKIIN